MFTQKQFDLMVRESADDVVRARQQWESGILTKWELRQYEKRYILAIEAALTNRRKAAQ